MRLVHFDLLVLVCLGAPRAMLLQQAKRRRGPKSWLMVREEMMGKFPPGPQSRESLENWPLDLARGLFQSGEPEDEEMMLRMMSHMQTTMVGYTDYSGVDAPRDALHGVLAGVQKIMGWPIGAETAKFVRTCDKGIVQTAVCVNHSKEQVASGCCHFLSIEDRLPPSAQDYLHAASASSDASKQEREDANKDIACWVANNRNWLYPTGATTFCQVHQKQCANHPKYSSAGLRGDEDERPSKASRCSRSSPTDNRIGCGKDDDDNSGPLYFNVAGIECTPWSAQGASEQTAHPSDIAHSVWSAERRKWAEDGDEHLFFGECTPHYAVDMKLKAQMRGHQILHVTTGPELFGWPVRRRRVLMAGVNTSRLLYVGPTDPAEIEQEFGRRFYKSMQITGEVFFQSPVDEVAREYTEIAQGRKFAVTTKDVLTADDQTVLEWLLPPGALFRLGDHSKRFEEIMAAGGAEAPKVHIIDVEHHLDKGSTGGLEWPVQLTHGTILKLTPDGTPAVAVGMDHFASMGFNMFPTQNCSFERSSLYDVLSSARTSHRHKKMLAGNSMHLVTQAAWMAWVLSNCIRVRPVTVARPLTALRGSWEDSELDDME